MVVFFMSLMVIALNPMVISLNTMVISLNTMVISEPSTFSSLQDTKFLQEDRKCCLEASFFHPRWVLFQC